MGGAGLYPAHVPTDFSRTILQEISAKNNLSHTAAEQNTGIISRKTAAKIIKNINCLIEVAKSVGKTSTFLTLTLPAPQASHTDNDIKRKVLTPFIQELQRVYGVELYLWRAETQANGNIHFHLVLDKPIYNTPKTGLPLTRCWNKHTETLGFVTRYAIRQRIKYKNGFFIDEERIKKQMEVGKTRDEAEKQQKAAYTRGVACNWSQPNSVDIHAIKSIDNLAAYVAKYCTKNEPIRRKVEGRLWGCSDKLRKVEIYKLDSLENRWDYNATKVQLDLMAEENPDECKKFFVTNDSEQKVMQDKVYYEKYSPNQPDKPKIFLIKYNYPEQLWKKYAPKNHFLQRKKHYLEFAKDIYNVTQQITANVGHPIPKSTAIHYA